MTTAITATPAGRSSVTAAQVADCAGKTDSRPARICVGIGYSTNLLFCLIAGRCIQRSLNTSHIHEDGRPVQRGLTGYYKTLSVAGETVRAFVPHPLPPRPSLEFDSRRQRLLEEATLSLGRLDSVTLLLSEPDLFLYAYVRREAVLSSQIEGTQSSLAHLLLFELEEAPGVPLDDVTEVSNYVAALDHGLNRLKGDSHSVTACFGRCTASCFRVGGEVGSLRGSFGARKTGSGLVPAMRTLCRRRPMSWKIACLILSDFSMTRRCRIQRW